MNVMQEWTHNLPMMQQSVLLAAVRGPDGIPKYGAVKMLLRWYRRCILLSATDGGFVFTNPHDTRGGSFTGPSFAVADQRWPPDWEGKMDEIVSDYLRAVDAMPHHFHMHLVHAVQIVGYKHPDPRIKAWWLKLYQRLVKDLHLHIETEMELDSRLGDTREGWLAAADPATVA